MVGSRHPGATWRTRPAGSARAQPRREVWAGRRHVAWALGGYLLAVSLAVGVLGDLALSTGTGIALGTGFLLAACVVTKIYWQLSEQGYAQQEQYRSDLFDAEIGALARLREAGQIREDLIASVSHEFRTPLTAIRGSAVTLLAKADQICPQDRDTLLKGVVEHSERLGRLLEDMLLAASATGPTDAGAIADVSTALVGLRLGQARPIVHLDVQPQLAAYVDVVSLDQIVRALADHIRAESRRDRPVTVRARGEDGEVAIVVAYAPVRAEQELAELFEAFSSRETARTGRPSSLALYVVRRLVEAHGGRVAASREGGYTRLRVTLRRLRSAEARWGSTRPAGGQRSAEPAPSPAVTPDVIPAQPGPNRSESPPLPARPRGRSARPARLPGAERTRGGAGGGPLPSRTGIAD